MIPNHDVIQTKWANQETSFPYHIFQRLTNQETLDMFNFLKVAKPENIVSETSFPQYQVSKSNHDLFCVGVMYSGELP